MYRISTTYTLVLALLIACGCTGYSPSDDECPREHLQNEICRRSKVYAIHASVAERLVDTIEPAVIKGDKKETLALVAGFQKANPALCMVVVLKKTGNHHSFFAAKDFIEQPVAVHMVNIPPDEIYVGTLGEEFVYVRTKGEREAVCRLVFRK